MKLNSILIASTVFVTFALAKGTNKTTSFYNTDKCGKSMGCWTFPNDCENRHCHAIIRWKTHKNLIRIELQAKDLENSPESGRYMALGFSEDKFMDNDTVIECVFDANGKAKAFVSYNDHSRNVRLEDASSKLVKLRQSTKSDGRLLCKIDGLADPQTREKFIHAFYPWSTDEAVEMCDDCKYQVVTQTSPHEVRRLR